MQEETSRASLSMMIPRDQTVSSWYTAVLLTPAHHRSRIVYRRQDTDIVRREGLPSRPKGSTGTALRLRCTDLVLLPQHLSRTEGFCGGPAGSGGSDRLGVAGQKGWERRVRRAAPRGGRPAPRGAARPACPR